MGWRPAFSTLGCSRLPLEDVLRLARSGGWDGLELRAAEDAIVHVDMTVEERRLIRRALTDAGVEALAVASYVDVDEPGVADDVVVAAVLRHVELAHDIGAAFVRVFPGGPSVDGAAVRRLASVARRLDDHPGVSVALETHDSCARGRDVADVLSRVGDKRVRAIWDIQHPWRAGEEIGDTLRALRPFLGYVQITDARSIEDLTPCLLGTGILPLRQVYDTLRSCGYDGWVSLEWASYWYESAPPLPDALRSARRWMNGTLWDARILTNPGPV